MFWLDMAYLDLIRSIIQIEIGHLKVRVTSKQSSTIHADFNPIIQ